MHWILSVLALLSAASASSLARREDAGCTLTTKAGKYYDLNPLSGKDYEVSVPGESNAKIQFSPCRQIQAELVGSNYEAPVGAFISGMAGGDYSIGQSTSNLTEFDDRIRLNLSNGSKCSSGNKARTSVDFICDRAFGPGSPKLVFPQPPMKEPCELLIEWKTNVACPTSPPGSFFASLFAFLAVTILVIIGLYLVLGTLYNRFVLGLSGWESVPGFTWEGFKWHVSEMLDLARDWFKGASLPRQGGLSFTDGSWSRPGTGEGGEAGPGASGAGNGWSINTPGSASAGGPPSPWSRQGGQPVMPRAANINPKAFSRPMPRSLNSGNGGLNPASHFTQSQQGPPPPPKDPALDGGAGAPFSLGGVEEEEEEDGEEMKTPPGPKPVGLPKVSSDEESSDEESSDEEELPVETPKGKAKAIGGSEVYRDNEAAEGDQEGTKGGHPDAEEKGKSGGAIRL